VSEIDDILHRLPTLTNEVTSLNTTLANTRLSALTIRRNLLDRIRAAETAYDGLYAKLLTLDPTLGVGNMYKPSVPKKIGGVNVRVEISTDGDYFSNPASVPPANSTVYVRAVIDQSNAGTKGVQRLAEMAHLTWVIGAGYTKLDEIGSGGHDVYFVSGPLVITRKFKAPAAATDKNFMVYVDLYF